MEPQRAREIESAVEVGLQSWRLADTSSPPAQAGHRDEVLRPMPRRQSVHKIETAHVVIPTARRVVFNPGILLPFLRLLVWLGAALRYFFGNALDRLLGRASIQRRAVRLRETIEWAGGSFIKMGQQLSV